MRAVFVRACVGWLVAAGCSDDALEARKQREAAREAAVAEEALASQQRADFEDERADVERLRKQLGKPRGSGGARIHYDCSGPNPDPLMCDL